MKYALILVLALCGSAMADDCATNWMDCTADSPVDINSFTMHATQVIGSITAFRLATVQALKAHQITAAQATIDQNKADLARALWQQARAACHANAAGNCPKNSVQAFALLTKAQGAIQ